MKVTFDTQTIQLIKLIEDLTGVFVKDCLIEDNVAYVVVEEGKIGMVIGREGRNIKQLERISGKNIKLFEFSSDLKSFIKKLIPQAIEISVEGNRVEVKVNKTDRPIVIGRDGKKLEIFKKLLQRNHEVNELIIR